MGAEGILIAFFGCMLIILPAFGQTPVNAIEGTFIDANGTVEMTVLTGWSGIRLQDNASIVMISGPYGEEITNILSGPRISLVIADKQHSVLPPGFLPPLSQEDFQCSTGLSKKIRINDALGIESVRDCTSDGGLIVMKSIVLETSELWVSAIYTSPAGLYEASISDFEYSLKSFKVFGATDITPDENVVVTSVMLPVADTVVDLEMFSPSIIQDVSFDEDVRQLALEVVGNSTSDSIVIWIGEVLEGPYVVTIDGDSAEEEVIEDRLNGRVMLRLSYGEGPHSIVISGTRVVPEFPTFQAVIALAIAGTIVSSRFRRTGLLAQ